MENILNRILGRLNREKRKLKKRLRVFKGAVKKETLKNDLFNAGIKKGDTILVHSSLSKIGNVNGGAATVVEALIESVGDSGNVAMPAYSYVNTMIDTIKDKNFVFDVGKTASVVGKITETFRTWKNVKRSLHPTHSVCVHGSQAEAITAGHLKAVSNFGENTPFEKIQELNGKMVGLGVDTSIIPFYHTFEELNPDEFNGVYLAKPFPLKLIVNGKIVEKEIFIHDPKYYSSRIDKDAKIELWFRNHYVQKGLLHEGRFGETTLWWIDIQMLMKELMELKKRGITIYNVPD